MHGLADEDRTAPISLLLVRSTSVIDQTLADLRLLLTAIGVGSVTLASALLWWLIRRSLHPLNNLAREIAELSADDLGRQIEGKSCRQEIQPVVAKLNDLLGRLEAAFRREHTLNAAHELRTPLTGLRLKMDVAASMDREPHEYRTAIDECREITAQMQRMVEDLLSLAKLEAGQTEIHLEEMSVNELLQQIWSQLEPVAAWRQLHVQWELARRASLVSDSSLLAVVTRNLLENAVLHRDEKGTVRISTATEDGVAEIVVANSGSALTQAEADRAFEHFWRHDAARSEANTHCGLGLSLVQKSVAILKGTVSAKSQRGEEFEVRVSLPGQGGPPSPG
jgi:signal transduction histidine kinase